MASFCRAQSCPLRVFPTIIININISYFQIPTLLGGGLCFCVTVLHALRSTCKPASRLRAVFFLAFLLSICSVFLPSLFGFRFGRRLFNRVVVFS